MNRLILVGNGFDLAHGLKTSYKDFIIWYLASCFSNVGFPAMVYEDNLIQIKIEDLDCFRRVIHRNSKSLNLEITKQDLIAFFADCFMQKTLKEFLNVNENDISDLIFVGGGNNFIKESYKKEPFSISLNSSFFKKLIVNCQDCNWVDIENEYFDQLITCKDKNGGFNTVKVNQLNGEFDYLKQKLEEYLTLQQAQTEVKVIPGLIEAIKSNFEIDDFDSIMTYDSVRKKLGYSPRTEGSVQHDLYFLNFNYTDTLSKYEEELKRNRGEFNSAKINYIHGELNQFNNPIIFGFGDEYDKQYAEFEEQKNNELFTHIKSYHYLRTPNYRNLLRFLNGDDYQVFVMGHSCGLSDRTMFKEIFEHENCKSIRLFHYNNDFHDKAINISKHFSNKGQMRKLIVDYKAADAFPQAMK